MKKSLITMLVALVLVAAVGVGATLAFLTDSTKEKVNTFTVGNVAIELKETANKLLTHATVVENETKTGYDFTNLQPGDVVGKVPVVEVKDGSNECYIYVKITGDTALTTDIQATEWTSLGNGIYRYKAPCKAGDKVTVFNVVEVSKNATEKTTFNNITVKAAAVQVANIQLTEADTEAAKLLK